MKSLIEDGEANGRGRRKKNVVQRQVTKKMSSLNQEPDSPKIGQGYSRLRGDQIEGDVRNTDHTSDEDESSSEEEDDDAEMLTPKVNMKFLDTLSKIRAKDPVVYDGTKKFFDDEDFDEPSFTTADPPIVREKKSTTYRDFVRTTLLESGAGVFVDEEDAVQEKNSTLAGRSYFEEQKSLKSAFLEAAESLDSAEMPQYREQEVTKQTKATDAEYHQFLKNQKAADADSILSRYWGADNELDEGSRFLRDYILQQKWKDDNRLNDCSANYCPTDENDAHHMVEAEEYEARYNFRFEESGGARIEGHRRNTEGSARRKDDRRKRQRDSKKEKIANEKVRRQEELKMSTSLKRKQLRNKLQHLQKEQKVDLVSVGDTVSHGCQRKEQLENYSEENSNLPGNNLAADGENSEKRNDVNQTNYDFSVPEEKHENFDEKLVWWMCDACQKPILGGQSRFDCFECENYCLCKKCFRDTQHPHDLVKNKVPKKCKIPVDVGSPNWTRKQLEDNSMDEVQPNHESIVDDGQLTLFKYIKVPPFTGGLSTYEILTKKDAELNSIVSLKKLAAYRTVANHGVRKNRLNISRKVMSLQKSKKRNK